MKRYYDIDPLFNCARRLPMEVSIEQVQGFLATSAVPAGATKSWFNSFNFFIMLGIITGGIALIMSLSTGTSVVTTKGAFNAELDLSQLHALQFEAPPNEVQVVSVISTDAQQEQTTATTSDVKVKTIEQPTQRGAKRNTTKKTISGIIADPVADLLMDDPGLYYNYGAYDELETTPSEIRFMIRNDASEEAIRKTLNQALDYKVAISDVKIRHNRKGKVKLIKLIFAVADETGSCEWKFFRTVELKGFNTYEYGWKINDQGEIVDFWDQLNQKPRNIVPFPSQTRGTVKYFCKSY